MSDIQITATSEQIEKAMQMLESIPGSAEKALSLALNRSLEATKTEAVRAASQEYTAKQKSIRPLIKLKKSGAKSPEAEISSVGRRINTMEFKVAPKTDTTGNKRKPIRVQVKKGGGATLTRSFVHDGRVFTRIGSTGKHIRPLYSPAVPQMLNNEHVVERTEKKAVETVEKRLDHEVGRILDKAVK